jgi:hypothetical protein
MFPMAYHVYFGGSMTPSGSYTFPPGVALQLPANAAIDLNVHYVNKGTAPITGEAYANLYTVEQTEVQNIARTLNLSNQDIPIQPGQRVTHSKTFTFTSLTRVLALTSHTHKLGEKFVIKIAGGARDGEVIYTSTDWEHPRLINFPNPIVLQPGQGLRSEVTYFNNTSRAVNFGLTSEDEMGIIFGYYY